MQRLNHRSESALVLVMQRVHRGDLSSRVYGRHEVSSIVLPSVATHDEEWLLSNGRKFTRRPGDLLDPVGDTVAGQLALFRSVGDHAYATQYLQDTCGSENEMMRMRWEPKPPNWSPGTCSLQGGYFRLTYGDTIMHKAFGHPMPEYASWGFESPLTQDEWEAAAIIQQARLVAKVASMR